MYLKAERPMNTDESERLNELFDCVPKPDGLFDERHV